MTKYNLKCFNCGYQFYDKNEVRRTKAGLPTCGGCLSGIASAEHDIFLEEQWATDHPNEDYETWNRERIYIAKYGEC